MPELAILLRDYEKFPVFYSFNHFVPQSARLVLEVAAEQSDETHAIVWALAGMKAAGETCSN